MNIPDKSLFSLCLEEALNPFYSIMVFYIVLWIYQDYTEYSIFTFILAFITILGGANGLK